MKKLVLSLAAAAVGLTLAPAAGAATLGFYQHDYGSRTGRLDPPGSSRLRNNRVDISEDDATPFSDSFDFSELVGATIDSITLTLNFDRAGPSIAGGLLELWYVDILGSIPNDYEDNFYAILDDDAAPQSLTISAATDAGPSDAFATSLANMRLDFSFDEGSFITGNDFRLYSASVAVEGTPAVVPLPAPGLLLVGALGGLGLLRRRRRSAGAPEAG